MKCLGWVSSFLFMFQLSIFQMSVITVFFFAFFSERMWRALKFYPLLFTTIIILVTCRPSSTSKVQEPICKPCNYASAPKTLRMNLICTGCGEMFGYSFEHCCLCDYRFYDGCKKALFGTNPRKRSSFGLRPALRGLTWNVINYKR